MPDELKLLGGAAAIVDAMMRDIEHARRRIWIAAYIFRDDRLGAKLASALLRAHARGVDVRLLYDALGSERTRSDFIANVRRAGVAIRSYGPLSNYPIGVFPRNHIRIVLVDDVGYTGGSAWGDEWLPVEEGGKGWHDVAVRFLGPCVGDLERIFEEYWTPDAHRRSRRGSRAARGSDGDVAIVADGVNETGRVLAAHLTAIRRAKRRIWIENAYFFPPLVLLRELIAAARRGVDVRILLPGKSDLRSCALAARGEYAIWLRAGVKVIEYRPTVMHSKIAAIDDDWCTVGTFNINPASVAGAHELNVVVTDPRFVGEVAAQIAGDGADGDVVTADVVNRWPLWFRVWVRFIAMGCRALEYLARRRWPRLLWRDTSLVSSP